VSKQSLLLVDGDTRSLRVLEVSLRKAGFMVTAAASVQDALDKLELHAPDLIISETTFPDGDGFELRGRVRATPEWSEIPFIFLTAEAAIENKIRGLELGVDDYLTKPIYIKEIVTRINILLQKRQRVRFEERRDGRTRFAGRVQDMPVVDVIQTIEISRKSGVIQFVGERGRQAAIYFRDGRVIDAEAGALQGEDAVYRLLTWSEGEFEVVFRTVRRREVIAMSSQGLLMEGMRRLDEWSRLFEQLPPLTHRFEVDTIELAARLGDVPDDNNRILRLFDGKRTLLEVIDASDVGDLECLQAISRLYFEELLLDLDHGKTPRRDTSKMLPPLAELEVPSPSEDAGSGPVALERPAAAAAAAAAAPALASAEAGGETAAGPAPSELDAAPGGEDVGIDEELPDDVGPLSGGYRPSGLRLIDEAVAAAQAIEPSLFDDMIDEQLASPAARHGGNGVSHEPPRSLEASGAIASSATAPDPIPSELVADRAAAEAGANLRAVEREDSGLRMIGSLGRDRAEASGELAPLGQARPLRSETARELVTILPRRITRELPIVTPELAESLPQPTPTSSVMVSRAASSPGGEVVALPQVALSQRISMPGSGVRAPSRSRRLLRIARAVDGRGPGLGAVLLIVLAAVLAGAGMLLRLRRHEPVQHLEVIQDAAQASRLPSPIPLDAMPSPPVAPADAQSSGAAAVTVARDGGARRDGGEVGAAVAAGDNSGDQLAEAKALYDKGHDALEQGNFARALGLADASLKVRKTSRSFLLRAQAAHRLGRIDDALAATDAAARLSPGSSTVWEVRGQILWAAQRHDDARAAFEKYLELEPDSPKAAFLRRLMKEPR